MSPRTDEACPDLDGPSLESDLERRATSGARSSAAVPGAATRTDAALLRLCRVMTAATIRAGNEQQPPLTAAQIRVLTVLAAADAELPLRAIAHCLGTTVAVTSRVCAHLADAAMITRSAADGSVAVGIASAGEAALAHVNHDRLERIGALLDQLPPSRRSSVVTAAETVAEATVRTDPLW